MKNIGIAAIAAYVATSGLCVEAATAKPGRAAHGRAAHGRHRPPTAPVMQPMPACPSDQQDNVKLVVRVVIGPNYDPANPERNVRYKNPTADDDADDNNENGSPSAYADDPTAPFSIDLRKIVNSAGSYAAVRIVLKDKRYRFYNTSDIHGVGYSDPGNNLGLCGDKIAGKHFQTAVFFVKMNAAGANTITRKGKYEIGLVPVKTPRTATFIDPEVENNGFNRLDR